MFIIAKNMFEINRLKVQFSDKFEINDSEVTNKILGMEIHRDKKTRKIAFGTDELFCEDT